MSERIDAYRKKVRAEKEIINPDTDEKFTIRKTTGRDYIKSDNMPIEDTKSILGLYNGKKKSWDKMNSEEKKASLTVLDNILIKAVVEPSLTNTKEENKLSVDELDDSDYYFLIAEVSKYSGNGGEELKPFRKESNTGNTGQSGEAIQDTPPPDTKQQA